MSYTLDVVREAITPSKPQNMEAVMDNYFDQNETIRWPNGELGYVNQTADGNTRYLISRRTKQGTTADWFTADELSAAGVVSV